MGNFAVLPLGIPPADISVGFGVPRSVDGSLAVPVNRVPGMEEATFEPPVTATHFEVFANSFVICFVPFVLATTLDILKCGIPYPDPFVKFGPARVVIPGMAREGLVRAAP